MEKWSDPMAMATASVDILEFHTYIHNITCEGENTYVLRKGNA